MRILLFYLFFVCFNLDSYAGVDPKNSPSPFSKFVENKGQFMDDKGAPVPFVLFRSSAPGLDCFITTSGITYVFSRDMETEKEDHRKEQEDIEKGLKNEEKPKRFFTEKIELELQHASIQLSGVIKEGASTHHNNYFFSHCPDGIYDVKEFEKIIFKDVYPGIDWVLYASTTSGLKYDFVVHPGADVSQVQLLYKSVHKPHLNNAGDIVIKTSMGQLTETAPKSYLEKDQTSIVSSFKELSATKNHGHFETGFGFSGDFQMHNAETIIIDPQLVWATYVGGNHYDGPLAIETDSNGNVFFCGYTYSINYPVNNTGTYFQGTNPNIANFITKFSSNGALSWNTYYGNGNPEGSPKGLAIDKFGNVYVAGETVAATFPLQNNGGYYQGVSGGSTEIFILKFTNSGVRLWATFFGGTNLDNVNFIDTDTLGNLYIVGRTFSTNFPLLNGGGFFQPTYFATNAGIGILAKFDPNCNLVWSTFYGNWYSNVSAVNCDKNNNVYITGMHSGVGVPTVNPGGGAYFQSVPSPTNNTFTCFISKFSPQTNLLWSTNYGGTGIQFGYSIISDSTGNIFVGGATTSTNFPLQNSPGAYFQSSPPNTSRWPYILKFNSSGVRQWASFCGGVVSSYFDTFDNFAIDPCSQDVYYTFSTMSHSLATQAACDGGYLQTVMTPSLVNQATDLAVLKFSNNGALLWSTYLGGNEDDFRSAVATDLNSNLYMTGEWTAGTVTTYPLTNPGGGTYFDNTHNGTEDGYLVKFSTSSITTTLSYPSPICNGNTTVAPSTSPGSGTFSGSSGLVINPITGVINAGASGTGTFVVTFQNNSCNCISQGLQTFTVILAAAPVVSISSSSQSICAGQTVNLYASTQSSGSISYTWSPGGATTGTTSVNPSATSIYSLTAEEINGCNSTGTLQVTVWQIPAVSISGPTVVCEASSTSLTASGAGNFNWSTGQSGSSCVFTPTLSALYTVTCTSINGCTNQATHTLNVLPGPTLSISGATTVCKGNAHKLTASGANSYQWSNGSIVNPISIQITQSTALTLTGTATNGCQKTLSFNLALSPCTGLESFKATGNHLSIYPNPSGGEINIRSDVPVELLLEDAGGKLIQKIQIQKDLQIATIKLADGIYFLRGVVEGDYLSEKIIVSK